MMIEPGPVPVEHPSGASADPPDSTDASPKGATARPPTQRNPVLSAIGLVMIMISLVLVTNPPWVGTLAGTDRNNYAFLQTQPGASEPVTWDHCRAIRYQVNPLYAPRGWKSTVNAAFEDISVASGFVFVDAGRTTDRTVKWRTDVSPVVADPVLVMWSDSAQDVQLHGDVSGVGGSASVQVNDRLRYITGRVVLDADVYSALDTTGKVVDQRLILEHELGHVLGLAHVKDRHQLMFARDSDVAALGRGDIAGLKALHAVPCG